MKKILLAAIAFGFAAGAGAQITKTVLTKRIPLAMKAGSRVVCQQNVTGTYRGSLLDYTVPAGKTLNGSLSLSGELK